MKLDTPPTSPYNDLINEDEELIYLGDADEVLNQLENEIDEDSEGENEMDDHPAIPEQDDATVTFTKHNAPVFCGSFHPTENIVVTGGEDDNAFVWNSETGDIVHEIKGHKDTIIAAEFSRDGNYLATGDMAGEIKLFGVSKNYEKVWEFSMGDMSWMKWHHMRNILIAGSENGEIYAWRLPSGECKVFSGHGKKCESADVTSDGKKIIAGYNDGVIKFWDFKNNTVDYEVDSNNPHAHTESVSTISTDKDNQLYLTGSEDGKIMVGSRSGPVGNLDPNGGPVEVVVFAEDSEQLLSVKLAASATLKGKITIWDITKLTQRTECIDDDMSGVTVAKWLPELTLLVGTLDGTIKGFDGRNGQLKFKLFGHTAEIYDMKYNSNTKLILTASEDHTAKIFKIP